MKKKNKRNLKQIGHIKDLDDILITECRRYDINYIYNFYT